MADNLEDINKEQSGENVNRKKKTKSDAQKAKNAKVWRETMGILDAAQTALNNYPDLNNAGLNINLNYAGNPFVFLFTILKHMKGHDWCYKVVGDIILPVCYVLEYSVKAMFTARLTELLSCTLMNMRINEDLINNGFTINLKDVDLLNILLYSPLSNQNTSSMEFFKVKKKDGNGNIITDGEGKPIYESKSIGPSNIGRYFYFGCDEFESADDLVKAQDFNALLWYVKNRANGRVVWYGSKNQGKDDSEVATEQTLSKKDGILTLEYHNNGQSLTKADGTPCYLQSPSENCLHVFIGNTKELPKNVSYLTNKTEKKRRRKKTIKLLNAYNDLLKKLIEKKEEIESFKYYDDILKNNIEYYSEKNVSLDLNNITQYIEELRKGDKTVKEIISSYGDENKPSISFNTIAAPISFNKNILNKSYNSLKNESNEASTEEIVIETNNVKTYRAPQENYYYNKFLMTFNSDYIWSVKLFDPKVVAAQLIDALTGCVSVDMNLSIEAQILKAEVENIVQEVCNDDSYEINDCFFTFTNDGYNALLEKSELAKMGLIILDNDYTTITKENAVDLLSGLDAIGEKSENKSEVISDAIYKTACLVNGEEKDTIVSDVGGKMSFAFLENLMNKLATVIVTSVVSPKLYIMLLVNFQVMKLNTHFDIAAFIRQYKQILISIIRDIRDQLVKMLIDKVMEIVKDLIKELTDIMAMEQIQYYKTLIMQCMECVKIYSRSDDWTMAPVDYADITETIPDDTQDNNNC